MTGSASSPRALVTGGGGFIGGAVVDGLLKRGWSVRSFSRGAHPALNAQGVDVVRGDIGDADAVRAACRGMDVVFHVAAKAGVWGPLADFERVNVRGTANVIDGCRRAGVPSLIYTSSPSVVFNRRDMEGADESAPYPRRYLAHYPRTKATAEKMVLAANDASLRTVALRPHLVWGPGDNHLMPRIVARGRAGRLRRIGKRDKLIDSTYIDNAAEAHILAAERLREGAPIGGKAYFITNGEPWPTWELINAILAAAGVKPVARSIPAPVAYCVGACMEAVYGLLRLRGEPPMTRFVAEELSTAHWFDISAARRDLGYEPRVTIAEGLRRLAEWWRSADESSSDLRRQIRSEV